MSGELPELDELEDEEAERLRMPAEGLIVMGSESLAPLFSLILLVSEKDIAATRAFWVEWNARLWGVGGRDGTNLWGQTTYYICGAYRDSRISVTWIGGDSKDPLSLSTMLARGSIPVLGCRYVRYSALDDLCFRRSGQPQPFVAQQLPHLCLPVQTGQRPGLLSSPARRDRGIKSSRTVQVTTHPTLLRSEGNTSSASCSGNPSRWAFRTHERSLLFSSRSPETTESSKFDLLVHHM
jgi:hypothetical protein